MVAEAYVLFLFFATLCLLGKDIYLLVCYGYPPPYAMCVKILNFVWNLPPLCLAKEAKSYLPSQYLISMDHLNQFLYLIFV